MRESSVSFCPVPTEQQPIHEYQELKDSWFFRWAKLELGDYGLKLAWVWGLSWKRLLVFPLGEARIGGLWTQAGLGLGLKLVNRWSSRRR